MNFAAVVYIYEDLRACSDGEQWWMCPCGTGETTFKLSRASTGLKVGHRFNRYRDLSYMDDAGVRTSE